MKKYNPQSFEKKIIEKWAKEKIYQAPNSSKKPKKYILDMFPYPSGDGLHVGHFKLYTASDVVSRYFRAKGFNVLHPMGWDAFGLPAENYAIKTGTHPSIRTAQNISNIKAQMQMVGFSYDWSREINTTDPEYYKWTQWIFVKLFEKGLAYEAEVPINWCPKDKTGLANEEVVGGVCDRCGTKVERKIIRQWVLRITKYADRLLEDLEGLDWPRSIKDMQINWIGKKTGINITYKVEGSQEEVVCFTTRPDTNFGATFIVIGPEHPLIQKITQSEYSDVVKKYVDKVINQSEEDRIAQGRAKTGVFTGSYAINNLNGKKLPIWVSDFVLGNVGTGAVVGVPGHDLRDFQFAKEFDIPIIRVVKGKDGDESAITQESQVQEKTGIMVNSEFLDGLDIHEATEAIMNHLEAKGWGKKVINYHLRDWTFSRQRYWGEPIPLVHCPNDGVIAVPIDQLPIKLPNVEKYEPTGTGESPLATIDEWVNIKCPKCGGPAKRETNTMPQWAGSCWYYLRFIDPTNNQQLVTSNLEQYWMPVDWYLGGAEHAVLHLLYARFWHKFLYDIKVVTTKEPFQKLSSIGLVLAADGRKMSKSLGNVVTPEEIVKKFGADALRVYEAFMGPFEATIAWNPRSINGVYRFLNRVWELESRIVNHESREEATKINQTIEKVGNDIEELHLNTAVAALMEFVNFVLKKGSISKTNFEKFLILLAPFAPFIAEELWQTTNLSDNKNSIHQQAWPKTDKISKSEEFSRIVVQINGRLRDSIMIQKDIESNKELVEKQALDSEKIKKFLDGQTVKRIIYVPGKVINFVI